MSAYCNSMGTHIKKNPCSCCALSPLKPVLWSMLISRRVGFKLQSCKRREDFFIVGFIYNSEMISNYLLADRQMLKGELLESFLAPYFYSWTHHRSSQRAAPHIGFGWFFYARCPSWHNPQGIGVSSGGLSLVLVYLTYWACTRAALQSIHSPKQVVLAPFSWSQFSSDWLYLAGSRFEEHKGGLAVLTARAVCLTWLYEVYLLSLTWFRAKKKKKWRGLTPDLFLTGITCTYPAHRIWNFYHV